MAEVGKGCVTPAAGPISSAQAKASESGSVDSSVMKEVHHMVMVGKPAPDFQANAYADGAFTQVKLSDFKGRWVVLCFYPGDFTFV